MSEEYLKNYPGETSRLFLIGYVLRIIPAVNVIGAILTGLGYLSLYRKWIRRPEFILGVIGSILVLSAHIVEVYYGLLITTPTINVGAGSSIDEYIKAIDVLIGQMTAWYSLIPPLVIGLGLFLETVSLYGIRKLLDGLMPLYIIALTVLFGLIKAITSLAMIVTASALKEFKQELINELSGGGSVVSTDTLIKLLQAMMPLLIVSAIVFILTILVYALLAYRFHVIGRASREASFIVRGEEGYHNEEIVI